MLRNSSELQLKTAFTALAAGNLLAAVGLLICPPSASAQSPQVRPRPQFKAATIKRSSGAEQGFFGTKGLTFISQNMPLRMMIALAYDIKPSDISGGPGWINSDGYNINAKRPVVTAAPTEGSGEKDTHDSSLMLQVLLEERCNLQFHWVTKDGAVFELRVAKGGVKLRPSTCIHRDESSPAAPTVAQAEALPCGESKIIRNGLISRLVGSGIGMNYITQWLTMITGRTVLDKTGTGFGRSFDVSIEFTPDSALQAAPDAFDVPPVGPSISPHCVKNLG